jgi:hypothetical protein
MRVVNYAKLSAGQLAAVKGEREIFPPEPSFVYRASQRKSGRLRPAAGRVGLGFNLADTSQEVEP